MMTSPRSRFCFSALCRAAFSVSKSSCISCTCDWSSRTCLDTDVFPLTSSSTLHTFHTHVTTLLDLLQHLICNHLVISVHRKWDTVDKSHYKRKFQWSSFSFDIGPSVPPMTSSTRGLNTQVLLCQHITATWAWRPNRSDGHIAADA